MRSRLAYLFVLLGAVAAVEACGNDETGIGDPALDAGADGSAPGKDAGQPPVEDSGTETDTGTDSGDNDAGDAADASPDGGFSLDGGACDGGVVTVASLTPQFGATGASTAITITGDGFVSTPRVYLVSGGTAVPAMNTGFVSSTSITTTVPSGLAAGTYDIAVINPGECAGTLAGGFKVVANPAPLVLSVAPAHGTTQNDVNVTVTGCHFQSNATLATVNAAGTVVDQTVSAAPVAGANDPRCNNGPLYTLTGTIQTKTKAMPVGAYLVRVTNPTDATFGEYASFVVSNPSGNLVGGWTAAPSLVTGRRALGAASARLDDASRFLYAVGGEDAAGSPLGSIEVAALDRFGKLGSWAKQKNELKAARSGHAIVRQGLYLYAIGGTSSVNGTRGAGNTDPSGAPLASIERAKLLEPSGAPKLDTATASTASGTLPKGTYYYRVAAVLDGANPATEGETLPSEVVATTLTAAGHVQLSWTAPAVGSVASYRVYRTAAADGAAGSEVLLKTNIAGTTFTDTGADTAGTEKPMTLGSTGPWVTLATSLNHARLNTAATIAPDPNGQLHLYVVGGWGQCAAAPAAQMSCYEFAPLSSDGATLGAFTDGTTTLGRGRMRIGIDTMTAANGPSSFAASAGASTAFVVVAGGKGASATANTSEYATVTAGGQLSAWASPTGFSTERDGTQLIIANGYGYALFGGNPPSYNQTADQSAVPAVTSTSLTFPNWSNAAANLGNKLGRHGAVSESAYFYVIGGTTNDTDALATVIQVLH